ncbi:MAG: hypothetical protein DI630_10965 [Gordonia sp. (in: high G+C Gram-positive bacteria)]|nr:MAG: hypothetical protein DI630_10965 [Gordonia sp. (in: high G+C Gram-positive bacteria)]
MIRFTRKSVVAAAAAGAGAAALTIAAAPTATAAPEICPSLPGQTSAGANCYSSSGPTGLTLAITADGGVAVSTGNNFSGPAAIALGPGAVVEMQGVNPGLSIGIAGPGATVVVDGQNRVQCTDGISFAGDFQTWSGCFNNGTTQIPLG